MKIQTYIIDAFTNTPFKGNPAAVCLLERPIPEETMQSIGSEMNLSETAFIWQAGKDNKIFNIRYFTPKAEIPFCGHATLASAKLLQDMYAFRELQFITHHDLAIAVVLEGKKIKMQFPNYQQTPYTVSETLCKGLGIASYAYAGYNADLAMVVIEVSDIEIVKNLRPDFSLLLQDQSGVKEVVVTASALASPYDFMSRCFCPWLGINEDPVTGAAHAVLARYWQARLQKSTLLAYQASQRGGSMAIEILSEAHILVTGEAVIVLRGELDMP